MSLSTKYTEPPKCKHYRDDLCYYWAEVRACSMSDPPRHGPETWIMKRKFILVVQTFRVRRETKVRRQILNKGEWRREKNKKKGRRREIQWSPLPLEKLLQRRWVKQKQARRDKQSNESLENFSRKMTHFFHLRERVNACLSKRQRTIHCSSMSHFLLVFFPQLYWKSYGT